MIKIIHEITGDCATKNTAKKGAGSYTRWNENGHVFVIDARGWGASRCGRRGRWSGCTYPPTHPNASSSLLPPSLLSDPSVHSREIAAGSASEGGWNENGGSLPRLHPFGGDVVTRARTRVWVSRLRPHHTLRMLLFPAALGSGQNRHAQSRVLDTL